MEYTTHLAGRDFVIQIVPVPHSHQITLSTVCSICLFVAWGTLGLRFYTRGFISRALGYDDWTMLVTICFFTIYCAAVMTNALLADGKNYFSGKQLDLSTTLLMIAEQTYIITMIFLKLSLGIFFLRVIIEKWQKRSIHVIIAINTVVGIGYFFFALFDCGTPVTAHNFWERRISKQCVNFDIILGLSYAHAGVNALTDLLLALLPISIVKRSTMTIKEKRIIIGIFLIATLGFTASAARIKWIGVLASTELTFWNDMQMLAIWSAIEPAMGITAASMATLRPLLRQIRRNSSISLAPWSDKFRPGSKSSSRRRNTDTNSRSIISSNGSGVIGSNPRTKRASAQLDAQDPNEQNLNFLTMRGDSAESLNPYTQFNATPRLDPEPNDNSIRKEDQSKRSHDHKDKSNSLNAFDFNFNFNDDHLPTHPTGPGSVSDTHTDQSSTTRYTRWWRNIRGKNVQEMSLS